ncbi:hypothetical protein [Clostridium polynesiense]|uniref:hypothetical protein n=1 Tax=Clostridium polynesiense TaxID=1325933 RepID=UPI00059051D4|nr:hypothetical protein [Clostridium polynesiense]
MKKGAIVENCEEKYFEEYPGLKEFCERKKLLLGSIVILMYIQKISIIGFMGGLSIGTVILSILGISVPASLAILAYEKSWKFSIPLYFIGGFYLLDFLKGYDVILSIITECIVNFNSSVLWYFLVLVSQSLCMVLALLGAGWLTLSPKNREFSRVASVMRKEIKDIILKTYKKRKA